MRKRILVAEVAPAPQRIDLFNRLNEYADFTVAFMAGVDANRKWNDCVERARFPIIWPDLERKSLFGRSLILAKGIEQIDVANFDALLCNTNLPTALPTFRIQSRFRALKKYVACMITLNESYNVFLNKNPVTSVANLFARNVASQIARRSDACIGYCRASAALAGNVPFCSSSQYFDLEREYGLVDQARVKERLKRKAQTQPFRVGLVSYLSPRKGVESALALASKLPEIELCIIGSGSKEYEQRLRELAGPNVVFKGHAHGADKKEILETCDCLLFPTLKDSWGFVTFEALYLGLPVISTPYAMSSVDLISEGDNGFIYKHFDEMQALIIRLAKDPPLLNAMSLQAHTSVIGFNERVIENFCSALDL